MISSHVAPPSVVRRKPLSVRAHPCSASMKSSWLTWKGPEYTAVHACPPSFVDRISPAAPAIQPRFASTNWIGPETNGIVETAGAAGWDGDSTGDGATGESVVRPG